MIICWKSFGLCSNVMHLYLFFSVFFISLYLLLLGVFFLFFCSSKKGYYISRPLLTVLHILVHGRWRYLLEVVQHQHHLQRPSARFHSPSQRVFALRRPRQYSRVLLHSGAHRPCHLQQRGVEVRRGHRFCLLGWL